MPETHRIGTFTAGGQFTVLLDVHDGDSIRVRDFKVTPADKQAIYPAATRRYGGSRKAGEVHGNGQLQVAWILRDSSADEVLERWDELAALLESSRADLFYEWRPGGASRSTFFRLRGGLPAEWDYVWWQFDREILQLTAGFVVAPLAYGAPMDVLDGFDTDTVTAGDWTFDAGAANVDVAVVGGVLTALAPAFDPLTLSPALWLKADALTGLVNNDPVSTFTDSSGNSRDATAAGGARPLYKTNQVNSLPALDFDGANHFMSTPAFSNGDAWTAFIVARLDGTSGVALGSSKLMNSYGNTPPLYYRAETNGAGGSDDQTGVVAGTWHVLTGRLDATTVQAWVDGTSAGSSAVAPSPSASSSAMVLGRHPTVSVAWFDGAIAEVLFFTSALSTTDRDNVESYLGTKYGITVA